MTKLDRSWRLGSVAWRRRKCYDASFLFKDVYTRMKIERQTRERSGNGIPEKRNTQGHCRQQDTRGAFDM